jgi:hypothetical protein
MATPISFPVPSSLIDKNKILDGVQEEKEVSTTTGKGA